MSTLDIVAKEIKRAFEDHGVSSPQIDIKSYPEEIVFVVFVDKADMNKAIGASAVADELMEGLDFNGFVIAKIRAASESVDKSKSVKYLTDTRVEKCIQLMTSRARTSEGRPSLSYIKDAAGNISRIVAPRHYLVFGRRGAGKTALLLEAQTQMIENGATCCWVNIQTYRSLTAAEAFSWVIQKLVDKLRAGRSSSDQRLGVYDELDTLRERLNLEISSKNIDAASASRLVPEIQRVLQYFTNSTATRVFLFLDDFHYLGYSEQVDFLDLIHGVVRDTDTWIKISTIRHLSRWFSSAPVRGLQLGHDAESIDLDLSLQDPAKAKKFLERMAEAYARASGISTIHQIVSSDASDRLVLASGAVPRDYLTLCSAALSIARERKNARSGGKEDVAKASGQLAEAKISELQDDATSTEGSAADLLAALNRLRAFCLEEERWTFFRVATSDKEQHPKEYSLLQGLMDVRLVHLINSSVSDPHAAGVRSEAYMLDLSQFSSRRMKQKLHVIDFSDGAIALSETGVRKAPIRGTTSRGVIAILRRGPEFELDSLSTFKLE